MKYPLWVLGLKEVGDKGTEKLTWLVSLLVLPVTVICLPPLKA